MDGWAVLGLVLACKKKSSSLLSVCIAMKAAKQAQAFQLVYKSISFSKPSSSAHATNPKAKYRARFFSPPFFFNHHSGVFEAKLFTLFKLWICKFKAFTSQVHPKR